MRRTTVRKCPLVMIEWVDSAQPVPKWQHLTHVETPNAIKCVSVGWLVSDSKETKSLAPNMGAVDAPDSLQVSGVITIPTACIRRITKLKEPALAA